MLSSDTGSTKAIGLFNDFFASDGLYYWIAFMADVLAILNELSSQLQAKDLHVSFVPSIVSAHVSSLRASFLSGTGVGMIETPRLKTLVSLLGAVDDISNDMDIAAVHASCVNYVERVVECVNVRFPSATSKVFCKFARLYPEQNNS